MSKMSKIAFAKNSGTFLTFLTFSGTFLTYIFEIYLKMASKLTKNGPKMVKNYENYTGIFDSYQK